MIPSRLFKSAAADRSVRSAAEADTLTPPGVSATPIEHVSATTPQLATRIWSMFQRGMDTNDIAKSLGIPEARASTLLWQARCREKNLPAEYLGRRGILRVIAQ